MLLVLRMNQWLNEGEVIENGGKIDISGRGVRARVRTDAVSIQEKQRTDKGEETPEGKDECENRKMESEKR